MNARRVGTAHQSYLWWAVPTLLLLGCYRQDMARQPKYHWPDMPAEFFADGHINRPVEPDTCAAGNFGDDLLALHQRTGASWSRIGRQT